jgi:hypothetical protein
VIEDNIEDDDFFRSIDNLTSLLDFQCISTNEEELFFIKKIVEISVSQEVIESIQPEQKDRYTSRNRFYANFYAKLAKTYQIRKDIANVIETDVIDLLTKIDELNNYDDPTSSNSSTINMEILYSFVQNISKQNSQLISFLIPIIFRLYSNHKENSDIGNILSVFLTLSNESDTLALNANLLWQFFLLIKPR